MTHMRRLYRRHYAFILLFLLFISFRLLAILLFRPGGFITDFSDYDFYYTWGTLVPMGYHAYDNLWTAYPPLFPALMLSVFEAASRIPPWVEPRLAFHVLFGLALLLFESASFVLIYRLGNRLGAESGTPTMPGPSGAPLQPGLIPAALYALFFVPVYTLIGWFEPMPLFFMLLGLDMLLVNRAWGWPTSAVAAGLGFLTKLTPILLVPIAVRWLGAKLSFRAARGEWFNRNSPGNIGRATAYVVIFSTVVIAVGYPLVRANPALAFSSFRIQSIRPAWQSVWALLDGFYGYGLVPLDMRNLDGLAAPLSDSRLPWTWIGVAFAALYLWLYTRPYDWRRARTPITFSAVSILLLFLYSKGWSPQFLLWVLVYIALLLPTLRGVVLAIALSLINFVEADVFLILLPDEHWIMAGTVLARTSLLVVLTVEFLGQIWPAERRGAAMRQLSAYATWSVIAVSIVAAAVSAPRAAQAYQDRRLAEHPCIEAIAYLQNQATGPTNLIITQQTEVWRDLYPWLRSEYDIHVLDGYSPDGQAEAVVIDRLDERLASGDNADSAFWWIERSDVPASATSPLSARDLFFQQPRTHILDERLFGPCALFSVAVLGEDAIASADIEGGPIRLLDASIGAAHVGGRLPLVLYWTSEAPVGASYTVFTQLLRDGQLVAQQDNLPVEGLAPTDTWQPGSVIRDPYLLDLDALTEPGLYDLFIGLYDDQGNRAPFTLEDGTVADHIAFRVEVMAQ